MTHPFQRVYSDVGLEPLEPSGGRVPCNSDSRPSDSPLNLRGPFPSLSRRTEVLKVVISQPICVCCICSYIDTQTL